MNWTALDIMTAQEREAVALALFNAGYEARRRRRKDGSKTIIYIEYRRDGEC